MIQYKDNKLVLIEDRRVITNEQTLAFSRTNGAFIQITPTKLNINGEIRSHRANLVAYYCSQDYAATFTDNGEFLVFGSNGQEIVRKSLEFMPNKIAASEIYYAFSVWSKGEVIIMSKDGDTISITS